MKRTIESTPVQPVLTETRAALSRRKFLALAGIGLVASAVTISCKDDGPGVQPDGTIDLGSGDIGILNYAYALEQLEAGFYTQVTASFYSGATAAEKARLTEIRDHEIAHREFFKAALGTSAIPELKVNFSKIDFKNRDNVLATAKAFEDLGVSAYNGAGQLIVKTDYLLLAGKIVSVEARHAAYIRDIIDNGSFAASDIVDGRGMDRSLSPAEVLSIAGNYLTSKISANNLPKS